ncbi:hypothetical protein HPP92_023660 [Vanilla planifolia]|uniref:Uncharacterized protein n=1 Tax=Vanilla planifolia TaxID=51239 RepID=A0A835UBV0_VANPL|nr:hypothetical protein HPP92_023660 [Vanilla planifolia]
MTRYDGQVFESTMDDIHMENLARLRQMSAEEITEAQTEIIEKMKPAIIDMLKRRVACQRCGKPLKRQLHLETGCQKVKETATFGRFGVKGLRSRRDFSPNRGEPAALGYSIKEAVALMRSMVPAQRALALKLLNIILNKALFNLMNKKVGHEGKGDTNSNGVDWQAIWAYVLGPEPQLVLSLRIALDDNHDSVVLACAKVIQCILSCDLNENFFSVAEKVPTIQKVLCTAPVFRSRPEVDDGFLHGGFWKYNTKPSNILPSNVDSRNNEHEENHTIQDDLVVAGQDIAAGLVRMGLIPRICYLLEMEPVPALVECLVSVLIGLARHSLVCANAIIQCSSLIQSLVSILTRQGMMEIRCQIKAVTLLKVLCQMDKLFCSNFVKGGIFQQVMWHWYRSPLSMDEWVQYGKEYCKLMASLMIEQLRLWKVCIGYGYCLTSFSDFFPHMCLWLSRPKFDKLLQFDVLDEFAWITREAYHTLATLAEWLPSLHSVYQQKMTDINLVQDGMETWSWGNVVPMVDLAISWLSVKDIPYICLFTHFKESALSNSSSLSSMIWVVSAVMHMLSSIFHRISPKNAHYGDNPTVLPWLPQFAPKVGIELVKNGILSFSGLGDSIPKASSLSEGLCYLRHHGNLDVSLSSTSCLLGLVRLASLVDKCIQGARNGCDFMTSGSSEIQERILAEGMTKWAKEDLTKSVGCIWQLGWASAGGGFWSLNVLQAQTDAQLVLELFGVLPILHEEDLASAEVLNSAVVKSSDAMMLALHRVNYVLSVCLVAGPGVKGVVEDALCILLQPIVLKYLGLCLHHYLIHDNKHRTFRWQYEEQDYVLMSKILKSHFIERWLTTKKKASESPVFNVPLAWKLHALSMSLRVNMIALEDNGTREMFESLQELYGKQLDDLRYKQKKQELEDSLMSLPKTNKIADGLLCFQSQVFDGYSTFVEDLIEQFGSVSYGDIIFARQVTIYLHQSVDIPVRLAAWNSLSNNHLLELLPTLETCLAQAEGYLEPPEENEGILEAYTKSWTSGCLDRAYTRGSIAFILALHHLNSFLFKSKTLEKLKLRNKLTKALLRSCSHKQHSDGMLIQLVQYKLPPSQDPLRPLELKQRLVVLNEACEGNSSLLAVIDNLKSALER